MMNTASRYDALGERLKTAVINNRVSGPSIKDPLGGLYFIPKEVVKDVRAKAAQARKKCNIKGSGYMHEGKCVHFEDALFRFGSPGLPISKNGCVQDIPFPTVKMDAITEAKADVLRREHNAKVLQLEVAFKKRIAEWKIDADARYSMLDNKAGLLHDSVVLRRGGGMVNIEQEQAIGQKIIQSKNEEAALKIEQAITAAFARLEKETLQKLDRLAKELGVLIYFEVEYGHVAGLSKVPKRACKKIPVH